MSNPNRQDRQRWIRGEESPDMDDFGRSADRGRKELSADVEAAELMKELDLAFAAKFGDLDKKEGSSTSSVGGATAGAEKDPKSHEGATVRRLSRLYAIAAAILLLIAAGSWWLTHQPAMDYEALYAEAFTPYANELDSRTMGGEDSPASLDEKLAAASLAYDRRDYAAAATAFADYLASAPAAAPASARLYYGISLLGANKAGEAIPVFDELANNNASYRDTARWYQALALLRSQQPDAARQILTDISSSPSSPFAQRANTLLKAMQ
ncbi:tetratricopeptide repeat protein [Neolewinella agarilytica]|uniref:Tetratricopeptide repeat-containing protein n=1 Tax=Neolewinella agarilytica TaxID=478744 RepID=A0A1H9F5F0_9BACT|nr:hypothetical protein [Neolewinella agarilytica]SEQ33151.1 hypothetical protein SAMN05444359_10893 [Neolewinella agarilytica]